MPIPKKKIERSWKEHPRLKWLQLKGDGVQKWKKVLGRLVFLGAFVGWFNYIKRLENEDKSGAIMRVSNYKYFKSRCTYKTVNLDYFYRIFMSNIMSKVVLWNPMKTKKFNYT